MTNIYVTYFSIWSNHCTFFKFIQNLSTLISMTTCPLVLHLTLWKVLISLLWWLFLPGKFLKYSCSWGVCTWPSFLILCTCSRQFHLCCGFNFHQCTTKSCNQPRAYSWTPDTLNYSLLEISNCWSHRNIQVRSESPKLNFHPSLPSQTDWFSFMPFLYQVAIPKLKPGYSFAFFPIIQ